MEDEEVEQTCLPNGTQAGGFLSDVGHRCRAHGPRAGRGSGA